MARLPLHLPPPGSYTDAQCVDRTCNASGALASNSPELLSLVESSGESCPLDCEVVALMS